MRRMPYAYNTFLESKLSILELRFHKRLAEPPQNYILESYGSFQEDDGGDGFEANPEVHPGRPIEDVVDIKRNAAGVVRFTTT